MIRDIEKELPEISCYDDIRKAEGRHKEIIQALIKGKTARDIEKDLDEVRDITGQVRNEAVLQFAIVCPGDATGSERIENAERRLAKWLAFYLRLQEYYIYQCVDYNRDTESQQAAIYRTVGGLTKLPGINIISAVKNGDKCTTTLCGKPAEMMYGCLRIMIDLLNTQNPNRKVCVNDVRKLLDKVIYQAVVCEELEKPENGASGVLNFEEFLRNTQSMYTICTPDGKGKAIMQADLHRYMSDAINNNKTDLSMACCSLEIECSARELHRIGCECENGFAMLYWASYGGRYASVTLLNDEFEELMVNVLRELHRQHIGYEDIRQKVLFLAEEYEIMHGEKNG